MIIVAGAGDECVGFFIVMLMQGVSVASYSQALSDRSNRSLVKDDLFRHAWMHIRHSSTRKHTQPIHRKTNTHTKVERHIHLIVHAATGSYVPYISSYSRHISLHDQLQSITVK